MKALLTVLITTLGIAGFAAAACAQGAPPPGAPPPPAAPPYVDTTCGSWQGDSWVPNGSCPSTAYRHEVVAGTIISVKGHLVTVQQTNRTVVIDDSAALSNQSSGRVAVGRQIVAHGYWQAGNFYATAITGGQPPPAPQP
jgi:hypothetical protein